MVKVFLNSKETIEVIFDEELSTQMIREGLVTQIELGKKLKQEGKKVYLLVDVSKTAVFSYEARLEGYKALNEISTLSDKIAVFGPNRVLKYIINFIIKAAGKTEFVKIFEKREDAENWLFSTNA